jgi:hypothetical protein
VESNWKGSCLCGKVEFSFEGRIDHFFLCHCEYCQKDTGSSNAANLISLAGKLNFSKGNEVVKNFKLKSTRHRKSFCNECGSSLPFVQEEEGITVIPAGSLDSSVTMTPHGHIFFGSKANWENGLDAIPKFENFPK